MFVKSTAGSLSFLALTLFSSAPARSQEAPPTSPALQEVVVTAQRRQEKLSDVPISMAVVTGATMEAFGEKSISQYTAGIPNLSITSGAGAGGNGSSFGVSSTRAIAIRGVFGNNTTSLYLNDTPVPMSLDPRILDLARVEVLRGPQGTLFGASAMGGTIRLITHQVLLGQTSGTLDAQGSDTDHGGGGYSADGTVNADLIPSVLGMRLSFLSAFTPGLYTRTWGGPLDPRSPIIAYPPGGAPVGHKDHVGAQQATALSAELRFDPPGISGLEITPLFMYQRTNTNGYPLADYAPDDFIQTRPLNVPEAVEDRWSFAGLTVHQQTSFGRFIGSGTYFYRNAFDLEDTTDINAIAFWGIPYYVPAPLPNTLLTKTWTGEVRFESSIRGPVQFVIGLYTSKSDRRFLEYYNAPGLNAASGGTIGTDLEFTQNTPNTDKERAAYVDVTYDVTRHVQISAGIRRAYLDHAGAYTANGPLNGGSSGPPATFSEHGEYDTAPRYTARYKFSSNHMVYASAAKGFRIGGTNSLLPPICDSDLAALGLANGSPFSSDSLWSYEVGSKDTWAHGRMRSSLAVYQIDWTGIQQSVYLQCTFNLVANSGSARSNGAELETDFAPLDNLTLGASVGFENARITQATVQSRTVVGQPLTGVPRWSGSINGQYTIPFATWTGFVRGQWEFTGARTSFNNVAPPVGRALPSYSLLNLRTGGDLGPWEITLFMDNVLDKLGVTGDLIPEGAELAGRPRLFVTRPRTTGLEVRRSF